MAEYPMDAAEGTRPVRGIEAIHAFTDFSPRAAAAVRRAAALARQHGASLDLVHVVAPPPLTSSRAWAESPEALAQVAEAEVRLAALAGSLQPLRARARVLVGAVDDEILGIADQASLLVLGARGKSRVRSLLLGTTSTRLLTRCERPMLVVRQDRVADYRRVLVPIDLRDDASTTLQATQALAPGAQIQVLHAYQVEHEGMLRRAGVEQGALQKARREANAKAKTRLFDVLAGVEQGPQRLLHRLKRGHPVTLTLDAERRFHPDLIVMSKRSRSRIEDVIVGSPTKEVVLAARCDVLVVPLLAVPGAAE
jgi:nucleotide-binding universal stress UspA family protein